jgi:GDPmannose 4,6-dehydratase
MKTTFITGVTGQDGSYLADLLLSKGYEVHGLIRQSTQFTQDKWGHLSNAMRHHNFHVHYGDVTDTLAMRLIIETIKPNEIYNLAAQSHVGLSFEQPLNTTNATALGPLNILESVKRLNNGCRFYQASSSELFGKVQESPQSEKTRFYPRSPYGCAKAYAHFITQNYREAHGMYAVSGILFNHESERRGENFVTRKITRAVGRIVAGLQSTLTLGNLDSKRDWGYAPEYVEAMWLMLQQNTPQDFVIGTGVTHTVQEFVDAAFSVVNLDSRDFVKIDPKFLRPSEVETLCANPTLAKTKLGWEPKVNFNELVEKMVNNDIELALREKSARLV